jgi:hypothetical protein
MFCAGLVFFGQFCRLWCAMPRQSSFEFFSNLHRYKRPLGFAISAWCLALFFMIALIVHTKGSCQWATATPSSFMPTEYKAAKPMAELLGRLNGSSV